MATQRPKLKVGIIGAGLGGLAAGVAVACAGADVTILEATKELGEIGAGIQVLPLSTTTILSFDGGVP
jgi:salicylate hydroxylase